MVIKEIITAKPIRPKIGNSGTVGLGPGVGDEVGVLVGVGVGVDEVVTVNWSCADS